MENEKPVSSGSEQHTLKETPVNEHPASKPDEATAEDNESDWEELDDVLDHFSASKKPTDKTGQTESQQQPQQSEKDDSNTQELAFDDAAFIKQLESGMAELMKSAAPPSGDGAGSSTQDADWDALAQKLSQNPSDPTELMKLLMGDSVPEGAGSSGAQAEGASSSAAGAPAPSSSSTATPGGKSDANFQDTIRKTMERMQDSGDKATAAASSDDNDDMLAQLLKAMEAGGMAGPGGEGEDDGNLDKIFMGIMEQLSNKEMLYEPMKELHVKFGPWLSENKDKLEKGDRERYESQAKIVAEIVNKFDEQGYSDDDPACRAFIWEKMQKMQAAGSPPDELVQNPLLDEPALQEAFGGGGIGDNGPQCPQQ